MHILETSMTVYDIHIYIYIYILIVFLKLIYFCISHISSHWCATKGFIPWCSHVIHHAGPLNPLRVPAPCPHLSPKPTPCPSPCPHLSPKPTPCPTLASPGVTPKVSFHRRSPINPPHVPAPCPQLSHPMFPPVSPSVTLKVSVSGALSDPLFWCSK